MFRIGLCASLALSILTATPARAGGPKCPPNMAPLAGVCIDQFEASVWVIPSALVAKALQGKLTAAALTAGGAVQVGAAGDDYPAFCPDTGNGCRNQMHALSLRGVAPSRFITWFQAAAACANAGKRLPTNAEWQVAAFATPDDASCVVDAPEPGPTGTQTCISEWGVYDMVGNVWELVADLVPTAALCTDPIFPGTEDRNCTRNVTATEPTPGAVLRGGAYNLEQESGVFAMVWQGASQTSSNNIGFRCAL